MKRLLDAILDLVFAPTCLGCDGPIAPGDSARLVCRLCRTRLRPIPPPICERCGAPRLRTGRETGVRCRECMVARVASRRDRVLLHPPETNAPAQKPGLARSRADKRSGWQIVLPPDVGARRASSSVPAPARIRSEANQAERLARVHGSRNAAWSGREARRRNRPDGLAARRLANVAGVSTRGRDRDRRRPLLLVGDDSTGARRRGTPARSSRRARCVSIVTFARALDARRSLTNCGVARSSPRGYQRIQRIGATFSGGEEVGRRSASWRSASPTTPRSRTC